MPKVSVIIPVYNVENYLEQCMDSIINQTLSNIEIICVNDGSTDNSLLILEKYQRLDSRIVIRTLVNGGPSIARNEGLNIATGDYIYFMDSDDILELDAIQILYDACEDRNLDILYFDARPLYDTKELEQKHFKSKNEYYSRPKEFGAVYTGAELFVILKQANSYKVSPCLQFIRRTHIELYHLRFYEGIIYEDNIFTLQCMMLAKRTSHIKRQLFIRRIRDGSITTQTKDATHCIGHFTVFIQMLVFSLSNPQNNEANIEICSELNARLYQLNQTYQGLNGSERDKFIDSLTYLEKQILGKVLQDDFNISASIDTLLHENQRLMENINRIKSSRTYRAGSLIMYIPSKVKGFFRKMSRG